ncbi:hypothetical protein [Duganella aceris]|uniref:Uncharacterized protein n=1 Tax=Duganella aceris TaxID=2703883 RepID=A0ABX0FU29_9BURK|nr:hypothetical protein [Duganella aceris]NGZ88209.1 hypothetical protein [Duganella aceris]
MRSGYGWRAAGAAVAMALGAQLVVAQIGPRHAAADEAEVRPASASGLGRVELAGDGLTLIRFQGMAILAVAADAEAFSKEAVPDWPVADLLLLTPGRYRGLAPLKALRSRMPVIVAGQHGATTVAPPGLQQLHAMQAWNTFDLNKRDGRRGTRVQLTALPGAPGTQDVAGFMLELGDRKASYRVYVSCEELDGEALAGLPRRLPGADLVLLPTRHAPQLLVLQRAVRAVGEPAPLTAAGYAFKPLKR